jgi:ATP-dependent helicase/nuclease subunit B
MTAKPRLYTIPPHKAFADALVAGLIRRFGGDPLRLARGLVLLPNNRSKLAIRDAFVRASGGALLLPRLVAIGNEDLGEAVGAALDPADGEPLPPAVDPLARRLILARLVAEGRAVDGAEAVRLAGELGRTLDQLLVEEVPPRQLRELDLAPELSEHWQAALALFELVIDRWPAELARMGRIDAAERRIRTLDRLAERWRAAPPTGFVCAAGVTDAAPAVARLLRRVSELPEGMVVLAGLATAMPQAEWDTLGPHDPDPVTGLRRPSIEVHPQFHLKLLLDRIGVAREEVGQWREGSELDAPRQRSIAIANALAPAEFTGKWTKLKAEERRLTDVSAAELATPAEEAQAIAIAMRGALETEGRTAALVTPDRALARRVAAHLGRWGIAVDDSAGQPLSLTPPGTLLTAIVEAGVQGFAPAALLTLLKHPLVRAGDRRRAWLDGVRALDLALRGPRPAPGLDGLGAHLAGGAERERPARAAAADWWPEARDCLRPIGEAFTGEGGSLAALVACVREAAQALAGDEAWRGPAGRAAADLLAELEAQAGLGPAVTAPALPALLRLLMDEVAIRPAQGGHPRLAIYGQIEARLQSADLMILGGLNEGIWPGNPAPDPWLAPRIRAELGLPGLERRIGVAAHDFGQGLGAREVLLTRARRDARAPALASRFWLRLQAMAGEVFARAGALEGWARLLDRAAEHRPVIRPEPSPAQRPTSISVTEVDRLKADPFAFYARRILRLYQLDAVDADPSAAWRGTAVHAVLERWARETDCAPDALLPLALEMFRDPGVHPLLRALWQPRLLEALATFAATVEANRAAGRIVHAVEGRGETEIAGVRLSGRFDRIDTLPGGGIAVVDYKTGKPPSPAAVSAEFSMQLGLIAAIAERGGFARVSGTAAAFEYWSVGKGRDGFGYVTSPVDPEGKRGKLMNDAFVGRSVEVFSEAAGEYLTGTKPFTAKLHPEYAPYSEYDQLMRLDEWYGRD